MLSDERSNLLERSAQTTKAAWFPEAALRALIQERLDDRLIGTLRLGSHTIGKTSQIQRHFEVIGRTAAQRRERLPQVFWLITMKRH